MANIKSAKKRINTIQRRREENKFVKATIATQIKKFRKLIETGKVDEAEKFSKEVYSYIDSACSKGVIHKNNASRKIGRLAETLYKAKASAKDTKVVEKTEAKVEEKPVETEVKAEKKTTRKTTAKKETTKKETAKKETAKKATAKKATTDDKKVEKKTTTKKATKKAE